ncbi:unnamed protein product [marine sediment metagenome]|uniref:Uncharacterized protein n=1 Tax=marine sediment metagenome TaxID=412755 RepID=X1GVT0_9ZZZZ
MRWFNRFVRALSVLLFVVLTIGVCSASAQRVVRRPPRPRPRPRPVDVNGVAYLRKTITELQEQLTKEKEKNRLLEQEVAELKTKLKSRAEARDVAPANNRQALLVIPYPACKTTSLGVISGDPIKLTGAPPGATRLRLVPQIPAERLKSISLRAKEDSSTINFSCNRKPGGPVTVASLSLKEDGLVWKWKRVSPMKLSGALDELKGWLSSSIIELCSDDRVLARYQFTPKVVAISASQPSVTVRLPLAPEDMRMRQDSKPEGWQFESDQENQLRLLSEDATLVLTLDAAKQSLKFQKKPPERLREIDEEIAEWKLANKKLKATRPDPRGLLSRRTDRQAQIALNEERIKKLEVEKRKLQAQISRKGGHIKGVSKCRVNIVLPNGVVLYRIEFKK